MSSQQIMEEREKLLEQLNPELINFLKTKRKQNDSNCGIPREERMDTTENER